VTLSALIKISEFSSTYFLKRFIKNWLAVTAKQERKNNRKLYAININMDKDKSKDLTRDRKGLSTEKKVIIVFVKAGLETVKTKKGFELVCADTHKGILKKLNKTPSHYRPDIIHRSLLACLDSPLNKAGHLQIYIQTTQNVLIEVSPHIRIPRTFKRFAGLMVQLLHKLKIRSSDAGEVLLKVIKNPVTAHLPADAIKLGTSKEGDLVNMRELAGGLPDDKPVVFCMGAHAHGNVRC
jgi:rRNA small subunit pseudouridine methyltransferase Nep1